MSRYIDDDKAIEAVEQVVWDDYFWEDIEKAIRKIPEADVREIKFAKWEFKIINGKAVRECSHCGWYQSTVFPEYQGQIYNFCPCCGFFTGTSWKQLFKGGQDEQIR